MFPYDPVLLQVIQRPSQTIADVLQIMQSIEDTCTDGDGLKWFNWLYFRVTQAVKARIDSGGFTDPEWMAELDVQFAAFYFNALRSTLAEQPSPGCWRALFDCRNSPSIGRIQFALAGINAHINHDLPQAIVVTCQRTGTGPQHASTHYNDYTSLNTTLESLIDTAKRTLHVRLLGDPLPPVSHLENTVAAWSVSAAREAAWQNSEILWHVQSSITISSSFIDTLDGLTTVVGKTLLISVP